MSDVKSLNNIQITTVCVMSDLAQRCFGRKLQDITIQETCFFNGEVFVIIKARISCTLFKGTLFFKKAPGLTEAWELVGMKSHIMRSKDAAKITFGLDTETGKLLIQ